MALTISRVSIGDAETERNLRRTVEKLGVPPGESWDVAISASGPGASWEVVLLGPVRPKAMHIDWEIVATADGARYRKSFHGKNEQNADCLKLCVRKLLWDAIRFRDNPITAEDPVLAQAYEDVVWQLLRNEEVEPVQVRFGVWREGFEALKVVCKVESVTAPAPFLPWRWWSTLVRTPGELKAQLEEALEGRRERSLTRRFAIAQEPSKRPARVPARSAPGAVLHGGFGSEVARTATGSA
jgi:hypothetical protein